MKKMQLIFVCSIIYLASGCTTIFSGKSQTVHFTTVPEGADVTIVDQYNRKLETLQAPGYGRIPRSSEGAFVEVQADGYKTKKQYIETSVKPLFFANCLWLYGFWLGMLIDYATDTMWEYPEMVSIELQPEKKNEPEHQ